MKTIILAGGLGTRISEYTNLIPKPMIELDRFPILWHIMKRYSLFGHNDFFVSAGYKAEIIKNYFLNYRLLKSDFKINLNSGTIESYSQYSEDWNISIIDTGVKTMTGGRIKRLKEFIGNETFMLTYGDGLSNIDIDDLLSFHKSHGKLVTLTAVKPPAKFGELEIENVTVKHFHEKPQLDKGWINGGFFVIEPEFLNLIDGDHSMLEREPLETAAIKGELMAFKHQGFWQCMDTTRDKNFLEEMIEKNDTPWLVK
jgi:glucose-1-phosphate cytidylyltransferase